MPRSLTMVLLALTIAAWPMDRAAAQFSELVTQARQALDADKTDEAMALLDKAVAADPKDPAALAWLGSAQVRKARSVSVPLMDKAAWVKKGFNTLDDAVDRFPGAFIVYMVRGITATQVPELFKKAPVAVQDLNAVVSMHEKNPKAVPHFVMPSIYYHLGLAHKLNGQPGEARIAWEKGKKLYPAAPETRTIDKELQNL